MSVEVEPAELAFRRKDFTTTNYNGADVLSGPFTQEVTEVLRLKNNNSDPVAFKVR